MSREEELITKIKAKELYDTCYIDQVEIGTFKGLSQIHQLLFFGYLQFQRSSSHSKYNERKFLLCHYDVFRTGLKNVDEILQSNFNEIIEKYVEMNTAHPFREGKGRVMRIWLDLILKKEISRIVDWQKVDKEDYLLAMKRSPIKDVEIKVLLK